MLPLLKYCGDQKEHFLREITDVLASQFKLTEEERRELLSSGQQTIFDNRVGWARTYLKKAVLLESVKRGTVKITERGLEVLRQNPNKINVNFLKRYPEFVDFQTIKRDKKEQTENHLEKIEEKTPEEILGRAYENIQNTLAQELLSKVKISSPKFFENLVVQLLLKMGYGGSRKEAGETIGQTGDGGIDGIIKEDKLGLDVIYIQAKRWENVVGSKEVRNFVGSLVGQKANKGVFITASGFTKDALDYVKTIGHKVILIDGEKLAQLMIDYDVGVSETYSYKIKKIDLDYFEEE